MSETCQFVVLNFVMNRCSVLSFLPHKLCYYVPKRPGVDFPLFIALVFMRLKQVVIRNELRQDVMCRVIVEIAKYEYAEHVLWNAIKGGTYVAAVWHMHPRLDRKK